jgi:uncharacterized protein involved in exopolysaccharide biosynthesis
MNFTLLLDHALLHRIGWALIHSLWQGAFIAAAYALLGVALRGQSAQARYLAGCLALALLAASPVITFMMSSEEARTRVETSTRSGALAQSTYATTASSTAAPVSNVIPDWLVAAADRLSEVTPWLALGWAAGVLVFAARLTRGFLWLRKLQATSNEPIHGEWIGTLNRLRVRFGISRPVRLFRSALVEVPTVLGWLRPVILLPASSVMGLSLAQLESILAHELAHVRRFDYLVNAGQCLMETVLFYHPVVWWISRRVREEREHCCDDLVVEICGNKLGYARALAAMEELRGHAPRLAFAANGGSLLMRIRRLLGVVEPDGTSPARRAGGLALIGAGLLLIVGGILLQVSLPRYQAVARIKLEGGSPIDASAHTSYDPYFIRTEFEVIQSEPVLRKVIDDPGLTKKWFAKNEPNGQFKNAETIARLKSMLSIRPIRNTSLMEIGAYSREPEEARDIANAVARAYRNYRSEQRTGGKLKELNELERRAAEQQQRVSEAQDRVDDLRASLGILDGTTESNGSSSGITGETLRKLENLRVETEAQLTREETLLDGLKKMDFDKLTQALPTAAPDTLLASLLEKTLVAEEELASAQTDFGPQHPEVVKVKAKVEDLRRKTRLRVEGIMIGLQERVDALKHGLEKLAQESQSFREIELQRDLQSRPYFKAKRELDELQRARDSLNTSLASARLQLAAPLSSTVEIMDFAETPTRPVFPNRPKATACIVLGILLSVLGFGLLRKPPGLSLQPAAVAA